MIDSNDILTLLSIPREEVLSTNVIIDTDKIFVVEIEPKDNRTIFFAYLIT